MTVAPWCRVLTVVIASCSVLAAQTVYKPPLRASGLQTMLVDYADGSETGQVQTALTTWLPAHFDFRVPSYNSPVGTSLANAITSQYIDSAGIYTTQALLVKNEAAANGWAYEDMFLHAKQDYSPSNYPWLGMDIFDPFEGSRWQGGGTSASGPANLANGVFRIHNGTYTDLTTTIYSGGSPALSSNDVIEFGDSEPFDIVNWNLSAALAGSSNWQYWNGSAWTTFTPDQHNDALSATGVNKNIHFTPPVAWTPKVENSSLAKYWIRLQLGSSSGIQFTKVWGDDLLTTTPGRLRGWSGLCQSQVITMNNGIKYCKTPPTGATARFRWQARVTGLFNYDYMYFNMANIQFGNRTIAKLLYDLSGVWASQGTISYNGLFLDNSSNIPSWTFPAPLSSSTMGSYTDSGGAWWPAVESAFNDAIAMYHSNNGNGYNVVANDGFSADPSLISIADVSFMEFGNLNWWNGTTAFAANSTGWGMDPFKAPNTTKGVFVMWDNDLIYQNDKADQTGSNHQWDNAQRGPVNSYATFLLGWNGNVPFGYNPVGYHYAEGDEVYTFGTQTVRLTSALAIDTSTNSKSFTLCTGISCSPDQPDSVLTYIQSPRWAGVNAIVLRFGTDVIFAQKVMPGIWQTSSPVFHAHGSGDHGTWASAQHMSLGAAPSYSQVWYWGSYFPATDYNFGAPAIDRQLSWIPGNIVAPGVAGCDDAPSYTNCAIARRDFANAIVLVHMNANGVDGSQYDTGYLIDLTQLETTCATNHQCAYRQLNSDGTLGPAILTSVTLRGAESAILVRAPHP